MTHRCSAMPAFVRRMMSATLLACLLLVERSPALEAAEQMPNLDVAQGASVRTPQCDVAYSALVRGQLDCPALFQFRDRCTGSRDATVATTALRLRCRSELLEKNHTDMQRDLSHAADEGSCQAMNGAVKQYEADFDLSDTPELQKATAERNRICALEARAAELAALENSLRGALLANDCATFDRLKRERGAKFTPDQSSRFEAAMDSRCTLEKSAGTALQACLDRDDAEGNFCGSRSCFDNFRLALPQDSYFVPYRAESARRGKICDQSHTAAQCFADDACSGERCSLPLRRAVGQGPLMRYVESSARQYRTLCVEQKERAQKEKEEAERQKREEEEERERQRREDELERQRREAEEHAELRRSQTIKLTICNDSGLNPVWVALDYYDFDRQNWMLEGWWEINNGECSHIGDRFGRGMIAYYAYGPGERHVWTGNRGQCVYWQRFLYINDRALYCDNSQHRMFRRLQISDEEYTLRLTY